MILVTGAGGKTGRSVVRALTRRGARVRGLVHRPVDLPELDEMVVGDMRAPAVVQSAMQGVRAVYHICPNMSQDEVAIGRLMLTAACTAGIEHFVYHSVLHPQVEAMPHHWQKMRVEEMLFESGLNFTILQPTAYMQNILAHRHKILTDGVYPVPYPVDARLSLVDLEDVGEAAAIILTEPGHTGATYELVGTEPVSQVEVAAVLEKVVGRPVRAVQVSLTEWEARARQTGLGNYQIDTLVKMFRYYERFGLVGNPNVLAWLLGRPPQSLANFVRRVF